MDASVVASGVPKRENEEQARAQDWRRSHNCTAEPVSFAAGRAGRLGKITIRGGHKQQSADADGQ